MLSFADHNNRKRLHNVNILLVIKLTNTCTWCVCVHQNVVNKSVMCLLVPPPSKVRNVEGFEV